MRKSLFLLPILGLTLTAASCDPPKETARDKQAQWGVILANQTVGNSKENAEQKNIAKRLSLTMNPGQVGYIMLFTQAGQPIAYYGVIGKVTSSGKRLTKPWTSCYQTRDCVGDGTPDGPSDEGTYGKSDEYIYWWDDVDGYHQWNGNYLYSDQPFRTSIKPLVIALGEKPTGAQ